MGALVSALPDIIAKVADAKGVPVPAPLAQHPTDDLAGKFASAHPTRRDPVWPRFPAVTAYLSGAAAEPLQLYAPVSTFTPITRVESLWGNQAGNGGTISCFGAQSVGSFQGWVGPAHRTTACAPLLQQSDNGQADRCSHQCAAQVAAATINTTFLAYAIS
ncbi:hypothetical protein GOODEAATRI_027277 [Goodea atripinnis]|uniref:Uncharacterized protein n=1 Tax=Goodea atripinnis TaxID=208336 RepID=A0ABV0MP43_9TELE